MSQREVSDDVRKRADDLVRAVLAVNLTKSRVRMAAREIAAAEERGRRRGLEERDELRALLKEWLPRQCALKPWPPIGSMLACGKCLGCRTLIALAPRDSGRDP